MLNKLDAIENQLEAGAHHGAARKLENDVARNVRRWIHDDYDVSPNQYDKSELLDLVADFRDRVSSLADSGGGNGCGNGNGNAGDNGRGNGNGNSGNGR